MSTVKAPAIKAPVSQFAQFVASDVKGGEAANLFRRNMVTTAFEQAFKGNYSPLTESLALCEGKAKKARAYLAGFVAAGVHADPLQSTVKKVAYKGALASAENEGARAEIAAKTASAVSAFFTAFDTVMAEPPKAKKAKEEPAADTGASAGAGGDETGAAAPAPEGASAAPTVTTDALVDTVTTALEMGMLTPEQVGMIRAALAAHDMMTAAVASAAAVADEVAEEAAA